jgi:hypothetical protein
MLRMSADACFTEGLDDRSLEKLFHVDDKRGTCRRTSIAEMSATEDQPTEGTCGLQVLNVARQGGCAGEKT